MPYMRLSVSGGWTVVERKHGFSFGFFVGFFKNAVIFPEFESFLFTLHKIHAGINFFIHNSS